MVKKTKAEETGEENLPSISERFNELQTAMNCSDGIFEPRGVFRFKTFEEFDEWKERYHPKTTRSSPTSCR